MNDIEENKCFNSVADLCVCVWLGFFQLISGGQWGAQWAILCSVFTCISVLRGWYECCPADLQLAEIGILSPGTSGAVLIYTSLGCTSGAHYISTIAHMQFDLLWIMTEI